MKRILVSCVFGLEQITHFIPNLSQELEKEEHYSDFLFPPMRIKMDYFNEETLAEQL